jgi:hypothetical protein
MPESRQLYKVIPWDSRLKDFVYGVLTEEDFDGKMNPMELKQVTFFIEKSTF